MRAGLAITQEEPIRNRADDHRDRKCRETEDTRDGDFKIRHKNSGQEALGTRTEPEPEERHTKTQNKTQQLQIVTFTFFFTC